MSAKDIEAQKSYVAEARERTARKGEGDVKLLKTLDENGDLILDKEEVTRVISERVAFLLNDRLNVDKNKDGKLSLQEYCLTVAAKGEVDEEGADWHQRGHFKYEDKDKDGSLSKKEIITYEANQFTWKCAMMYLNLALLKTDVNEDGVLSKDEFYTVFKDVEAVKKSIAHPRPLTFPIETKDLWGKLYWVNFEKLVPLLK